MNNFNSMTKEELYDYIYQYISISEFKDFVNAVHKRMSEAQITDALYSTVVLIERLKNLKFVNKLVPNKQCDMAITACLIHNYSVDWRTTDLSDKQSMMGLFDARFELNDVVMDYVTATAPDLAFEYIFEIVEAQLGENTPIQRCRPVQGQPTYNVAEVLFYYYNFLQPNPTVQE